MELSVWMTFGFSDGSRKWSKLLSVSCEDCFWHGYDCVHWVAQSCTTTEYRWLFRNSRPSSRTLWSSVIKSPNLSARGTASQFVFCKETLWSWCACRLRNFVLLGSEYTYCASLMPLWKDVPDLSHENFLCLQVFLRFRDTLWSLLVIQGYLCCNFPQLLCYKFIPVTPSWLREKKKIDPAEAMSRMKLWWNSMIVLELPMGRSSQFCRRFVARFGLDAARNRWATRKCNRTLCKACQGTIRQECPRATAQWRKYEDHARTLALLYSSGHLHWLSPQIWVFWISWENPTLFGSSPSYLTT